MDWRYLLAPLGVIAFLAYATNDEEEQIGTNKGAGQGLRSDDSGAGDHSSPERARHQGMGIELKPIRTTGSRKRSSSDGEAEAGAQRLGSGGSPAI